MGSYPKSGTVQRVNDRLRVSQRNLLLLPTAGWEGEEAQQQGPAPQPPPGQGYTAVEMHHLETGRSAQPTEGLQDCVFRGVSLEESSGCTALR